MLKTSGDFYENKELYQRNRFLNIRLVCQMAAVLIGYKTFDKKDDDIFEWKELGTVVGAVQKSLASGEMKDISAGDAPDECFERAKRLLKILLEDKKLIPERFKTSPAAQILPTSSFSLRAWSSCEVWELKRKKASISSADD